MKKRVFWLVPFVLSTLFFACEKEDDLPDNRPLDVNYDPIINPDNFVESVTNPYWPMTPGKLYRYETTTDEGTETVEVTFTGETKTILGVACTVIHDVLKVDGEITEDTYDWYVTDQEGNVWYMGEDTKELENGKVVSTEGAWEAGVDGAKPGILVPAKPILGLPYRQEYYHNQAEDWGKVIKLGETVKTPFGTFTNCLVTEEWTPLEPDVAEKKYYAPNIGEVKAEKIKGGLEVQELVDIQ